MPEPLAPRRLRRSRLLCVLAALVTGSLAAAPAAQAMLPDPAMITTVRAGSLAPAVPSYVAPVPQRPTGLPSDLEGLARFVPANSCDPHAKPGTTALGDLLKATYPGSSYGIDRTCGTDPLPTSEHYDGRAIDFFRSVEVPQQKAQIEALIDWLSADDAEGHPYANARRLGVMYLIWDNEIWGSYRAADGWRPYSGCAARTSSAYDTTCHRDHIHISLSWEGAMGRTSFWSREVAAVDYGPCRESGLNWAASYASPRPTPCPSAPRAVAPAGASSLLRTLTTYSGMELGRGDTGPVVRAVQQAVGAGADGVFGSMTASALSTWQSAHGVPTTAVVDAATWRALLTATVVSHPRPAAHPELTRYRGLVLRRGSHGNAVLALQRRLTMPHTPGTFGVRTQTRVQTFQRRYGLPATGVVAARTWAALGA